jgi:hypothetical protein
VIALSTIHKRDPHHSHAESADCEPHGTLDAEVVLPVTVVCDALGLDAGVLAVAVRARTMP